MKTVFLLSALLLTACGGNASTPAADGHGAEQKASVRNIDVATLKTDMDGGKVPLLIDVRTPAEFADGRVPGAKNMPLDQLDSKLAELESHKDQEIYVVCRSGARSARASSMLASKGFKPVNIEGGTLAWQAAGNPTEK